MSCDALPISHRSIHINNKSLHLILPIPPFPIHRYICTCFSMHTHLHACPCFHNFHPPPLHQRQRGGPTKQGRRCLVASDDDFTGLGCMYKYSSVIFHSMKCSCPSGLTRCFHRSLQCPCVLILCHTSPLMYFHSGVSAISMLNEDSCFGKEPLQYKMLYRILGTYSDRGF